jgi:hypothetical protein
MGNFDQFISDIHSGYLFEGDKIMLGVGQLDDKTYKEAPVYAPLRMFNRHGLIAGATGTGKTKTLQMIAEQLSKNGVPTLLMDIKGDLSGIAMPGDANPKLEERIQLMDLPKVFAGNPAEFVSISKEPGTPMRATVSEFGPTLLAKILGLNETQEGVLAMIFKYCDDNGLPLLDLKDLKEIINKSSEELKDQFTKLYGNFSTTSSGTILRKIVELEQQGAEKFFGEKSFEVEDLIRVKDGQGIMSIFRLTDIQDKPKLFSTFMLCLLAEIYSSFPELGDPDKPKLVLFIDEAHLIFEEASDELLKQMETTIKLIRSKGVGIFFITQNPADIPDSILGQLGMKVQHALRAFTAKDQKSIKLAAENFPITPFYDIEKTLTSMGIGEALVTVLNEKGIPTPLVRTYMRPPMSRMGVLTSDELSKIISQSEIYDKYKDVVDRESAYELLNKKLTVAAQNETATTDTKSSNDSQSGGILDSLGDAINSPVGKMITKEVTRGLLGVLGLGGTSTRRRKGLFGL